MQTFLVVQARYQNYEVGLFNELHCIDHEIHDKKDASKTLIPTIQTLLKRNSTAIQEISFIGVNQGPGPFTSLRIIITTVNGIAFATKIPLFGCNSLEALLQENQDERWPTTIALLNACNNDVYYALQQPNIETMYGCANIHNLLEKLQQDHQNIPIRFIGNGVNLAYESIHSLFGSKAYMPEPLIEEASLHQLAKMTFDAHLQKKEFSTQLLPIYLKDVNYTTTQLR